MSVELKFPKLIVDEYTSPIEAFATPEMSAEECYELIRQKGYRHLPVMQGGPAVQGAEVLGILSQRDLHLYLNWNTNNQFSYKAKDIMRHSPFVVNYNEPLEKVVFALSEKKIGSALVRDEDGLVSGIFTTTDALNALIELLHQ